MTYTRRFFKGKNRKNTIWVGTKKNAMKKSLFWGVKKRVKSVFVLFFLQ